MSNYNNNNNMNKELEYKVEELTNKYKEAKREIEKYKEIVNAILETLNNLNILKENYEKEISYFKIIISYKKEDIKKLITENKQQKENIQKLIIEYNHQKEENKKLLLDNEHQKEENKKLLLDYVHQKEDNKKLLLDNEHLKEENKKLLLDNQHQKEENKKLLLDNEHQKEKNKKLLVNNVYQKEENKKLLVNNEHQKEENKKLLVNNEHQKEENKKLLFDNEHQKEENKKLLVNNVYQKEENKKLLLDNNELRQLIILRYFYIIIKDRKFIEQICSNLNLKFYKFLLNEIAKTINHNSDYNNTKNQNFDFNQILRHQNFDLNDNSIVQNSEIIENKNLIVKYIETNKPFEKINSHLILKKQNLENLFYKGCSNKKHFQKQIIYIIIFIYESENYLEIFFINQWSSLTLTLIILKLIFFIYFVNCNNCLYFEKTDLENFSNVFSNYLSNFSINDNNKFNKNLVIQDISKFKIILYQKNKNEVLMLSSSHSIRKNNDKTLNNICLMNQKCETANFYNETSLDETLINNKETYFLGIDKTKNNTHKFYGNKNKQNIQSNLFLKSNKKKDRKCGNYNKSENYKNQKGITLKNDSNHLQNVLSNNSSNFFLNKKENISILINNLSESNKNYYPLYFCVCDCNIKNDKKTLLEKIQNNELKKEIFSYLKKSLTFKIFHISKKLLKKIDENNILEREYKCQINHLKENIKNKFLFIKYYSNEEILDKDKKHFLNVEKNLIKLIEENKEINFIIPKNHILLKNDRIKKLENAKIGLSSEDFFENNSKEFLKKNNHFFFDNLSLNDYDYFKSNREIISELTILCNNSIDEIDLSLFSNLSKLTFNSLKTTKIKFSTTVLNNLKVLSLTNSEIIYENKERVQKMLNNISTLRLENCIFDRINFPKICSENLLDFYFENTNFILNTFPKFTDFHNNKIISLEFIVSKKNNFNKEIEDLEKELDYLLKYQNICFDYLIDSLETKIKDNTNSSSLEFKCKLNDKKEYDIFYI